MEIEASATKTISASTFLYQLVFPISFWILAEIRMYLRKGNKAGKQTDV